MDKYTHKCVCGWVGYEKGSGHERKYHLLNVFGMNGIPLETKKLPDEEMVYLKIYSYKMAFLLKRKPVLFNYLEWIAEGANICPKCEGRFVLDLRKYGHDPLKNKTLKCIKNFMGIKSPVVVNVAKLKTNGQ